MQRRVSRMMRILGTTVVLIAAFRLSLPFMITRYVNIVLHELPGYHATFEGVTVNLLTGGYQIDSLKICQLSSNFEFPLMKAEALEMLVDWKALFRGQLVSEVRFINPVVNFTAGERNSISGKEQWGDDIDWTQPIKKLFPLPVNRLSVKDGMIAFHDFNAWPTVELSLKHLYIEAQNLTNAKDQPGLLPARVFLQATSTGNGFLTLSMKMNVMKKMPDLDLDLKFENVDMRRLSNFFTAYAKVNVQKGNFNLYSELAVMDGRINGYLKPLLNDVRVVDGNTHNKKAGIRESVSGLSNKIHNDKPKNIQYARRVPLQGRISGINGKFCPALWKIFRNAFIEALEKNTGKTISLASNGITNSRFHESEVSEVEMDTGQPFIRGRR